MSSFSAVVISYNGKDFLERSLGALQKSIAKPEQVIIVDDLSSDGTAAMVEGKFPQISLVRNEKNLGPTVARNCGATHVKSDYVVFLDNDVVVRPNTLGNLVQFLDAHPEAGMVGPKVLVAETGEPMWWNMGHDPNNIRETIGKFLGALVQKFGWKWLKNLSMYFTLNYWDYDRTLAVDWIVEGCFAVRHRIFEQVGGFDEQFFMYFEGPDLCRRVRRAGYKIYFYPEGVVYSLPGHTHLEKRNDFFIHSKYLYYRKYYFPWRSNPFFFWAAEWLKKVLNPRKLT